jgi:hypothetical protein
MSPQQAPRVGDRVGVPWGLDVLEGVVLRTYMTGSGTHAVVSVDVPGADNEPQSRTVTLPTTDLLPIGEGHQLDAPGSWVNEYQFARAVQEAVARAASRLSDRAEVEAEPRLGGQRPDFIVRFGDDHLIVVEVKRTAQTSDAVNQLASYLHQVRDRNPGASVGGMLVLQSKPQASVAQELRDQGLATVNWSTARDDSKLAEALTRLLEAA